MHAHTEHTVIVLDRSGSMQAIEHEVVSGLNEVLGGLRAADPDALVTLVQFDDEEPFQITLDAQVARHVAPITADQFQPRGGTPLYDAIGWTFDHLARRAARRADRGLAPEDIEVITITDGLENASHRWSARDIAGRIRRRKRAGWRFRYLGANQDAWAEGARIGLDPDDVSEFVADAAGTRAAFTELTHHVGRRPIRPPVRRQ